MKKVILYVLSIIFSILIVGCNTDMNKPEITGETLFSIEQVDTIKISIGGTNQMISDDTDILEIISLFNDLRLLPKNLSEKEGGISVKFISGENEKI